MANRLLEAGDARLIEDGTSIRLLELVTTPDPYPLTLTFHDRGHTIGYTDSGHTVGLRDRGHTITAREQRD